MDRVGEYRAEGVDGDDDYDLMDDGWGRGRDWEEAEKAEKAAKGNALSWSPSWHEAQPGGDARLRPPV